MLKLVLKTNFQDHVSLFAARLYEDIAKDSPVRLIIRIDDNLDTV